jgi:AcrR family transcriptional regulator
MTTTSPPPDPAPRTELPPRARHIVDQAVDYIRRHGLDAFQLRTFAPSIGTSHRMVIHYFGSKDRLLAEVFHQLRLDDIVRFRAGATTARELLRDMWDYYAAETNELRPLLFFDLLGSAFQHPQQFTHFLDSLDSWAQLVAELLQREGIDPGDAILRARTLLAGWRGLQIQLFATRDRHACDQQLDALLDALLPPTPTDQKDLT